MSAPRRFPVGTVAFVRDYRAGALPNVEWDALFGSVAELNVAISDTLNRLYALARRGDATMQVERALQALDTAIDELRHTAR